MLKPLFTPFPMLTSDRLVLRQLEMTDAETLFLHRGYDVVNKYLDGFRHNTIEQTRAFIDQIQKAIANDESIFWVIVEKNTNAFVGTICLWRFSKIERKAETGYTLNPDFQGNGYMHEALAKVIDFGFNTLKLRSIEAYTHKDNDRSIKLLMRNNFKPDSSRNTEAGSTDIIFVLTNEAVL